MLVAAALSLAPAAAAGDAPVRERFQQGVDYQIEARLDEFRQVLVGRMRLTYTNNSPDTLRNLYFHLYLNAFRPNSLWAREERRPWLDFQSLEEPDYAFERLGRVAVDGRSVAPRYPYAPDSTVVELPLPAPLAPGGRTVVDADWEARPSTLPRRQGRAGRHWDFAHWYPRIAVYDRGGWQANPLRPQGEFYGEFATYDVTLEVIADQVIAATGLPVEGDPGWERARSERSEGVTYRRDFYPAAARPRPGLGLLAATPPRPYRRVRWRAEDVHHFAWSADPLFRYEEGRYGEVVVRVLYRPEEEKGWSGVAVENAVKALAWLDTIFGPFVYPQVTIARRIEGGGTEFPMLIMQSGASEGLTLHEMGHQYLHAILANNEWKEAWLDEGFSTFQSRWYMERRYGPYGSAPPPSGYAAKKPRLTLREAAELQVLRLDLEGRSQPVATVAHEFREFALYSRMSYTKGSLIFDLLRYVLGEERFRAFLRTYYDRWKLRHVDEEALRETAEEVCGCDLGWFFRGWLHTTQVVDYAIGDVEVTAAPGGRGYLTTVEVVRKEDGVMPVEVAVIDRTGGEHRARVFGSAERSVVTVRTTERPADVVIDPDDRILDWNPTNNRRSRLAWLPVYGGHADDAFDWPFLDPRRRDARVRTWMPLAWYNGPDKLVVGLRARENLMGWLARDESGLAHGVDAGRFRPHVWIRWRNPLWWRAPGRTHEAALWSLEGRTGGLLRVEWDRSPWLQFGPRRSFWLGLTVMDADASGGYLAPGRWAAATTAEAAAGYREGRRGANGEWSWRIEGAFGAYRHDAGPAAGRRSGGYVRGWAELRWERTWRRRRFARVRLFAGGVAGPGSLPEQRRFFVAGAGPLDFDVVFWNPFLRSEGALLRRGRVRYFAPGDGGLRAYRTELGGLWALAATARAGRRLRLRPVGAVEVSTFVDAGVVDGRRVAGPGAPEALGLLDLGPGVAIARRIVDSEVRLGVDFPIYAVRPDLARDAVGDRWGFRWSFTLGASF
jgi:hypothetical protein